MGPLALICCETVTMYNDMLGRPTSNCDGYNLYNYFKIVSGVLQMENELVNMQNHVQSGLTLLAEVSI